MYYIYVSSIRHLNWLAFAELQLYLKSLISVTKLRTL
jgi:hypothetical protein